MISAAASLKLVRLLPRHAGIDGKEREDGLRSSVFLVLVQSFVPSLMAPMMSLAMSPDHSSSPSSSSTSPSTTIADLPRSVYVTRGQARCRQRDDGL